MKLFHALHQFVGLDSKAALDAELEILERLLLGLYTKAMNYEQLRK